MGLFSRSTDDAARAERKARKDAQRAERVEHMQRRAEQGKARRAVSKAQAELAKLNATEEQVEIAQLVHRRLLAAARDYPHLMQTVTYDAGKLNPSSLYEKVNVRSFVVQVGAPESDGYGGTRTPHLMLTGDKAFSSVWLVWYGDRDGPSYKRWPDAPRCAGVDHPVPDQAYVHLAVRWVETIEAYTSSLPELERRRQEQSQATAARRDSAIQRLREQDA